MLPPLQNCLEFVFRKKVLRRHGLAQAQYCRRLLINPRVFYSESFGRHRASMGRSDVDVASSRMECSGEKQSCHPKTLIALHLNLRCMNEKAVI